MTTHFEQQDIGGDYGQVSVPECGFLYTAVKWSGLNGDDGFVLNAIVDVLVDEDTFDVGCDVQCNLMTTATSGVEFPATVDAVERMTLNDANIERLSLTRYIPFSLFGMLVEQDYQRLLAESQSGTRITFYGGPHDGDSRRVLTVRNEYYRTSHTNDGTLYVRQREHGDLVRYVRVGNSSKFQCY